MAKREKNAIDLLKEDHDHVKELLEKLTDTTERGTKTREKLVNDIYRELEVHARIEEEIFYPAFHERCEDREDEKLFLEAREEHALVRDVEMPKLCNAQKDTVEFVAFATVVKDLVEHHIEEEENEMFARCRELFDQDELVELGQRLSARKRELMGTMKKAA